MTSMEGGSINDVSIAPQVWTRGRVEKVAVMVNNLGLRLVKIRVVQDRIPELGDKFSNRHGQKGTIGALLRAHDMPRTESGIVPDMIMNPHAIPSRMTIAQNLEQLLGKTAALSGGIGDGTSFMNDGSPQEAIGGILEEMGFEKYGNEVMYNGATGEQIPTAIFIGPVYGMRLKHMVEDKWQARGQGRREMRTHQPTGGRGAQGGLKIGEMDRDAIIAHGGMSFVKESFMERSDGAKIPLCVACGMIPIFNPRLNLAICPMCDGPVKYTGDTINNLEILPPLGRPKSRIVQVEIPYSTKLLTHEQETYLNMAMRYMTTSGFQRLTPFEFSGTSSEIVKTLPEMILPPIVAPAYVEDKPVVTLTVEQLRSMGAHVNDLSREEKARLDVIQEERLLDENGEEIIQLGQMDQMNQMAPQQFPEMGQGFQPQQQQMQQMQQMQPQMQQMQPQNQIIMPQTGGMMAPSFEMPVGSYAVSPHQDGMIEGGTIPGMGPMIAVRTDEAAFAADGLMGGRPIRRNMYRGGMNMGPMGPMSPMVQQYTPASGGYLSAMSGNNGGPSNVMQPITITKLE